MPRLPFYVALLAALLLTPAATARGASVSALGGEVQVRAGAGESNTLRVTLGSGRYVVTEISPFTTLSAGFGCSAPAPGRVECASSGLTRLTVEAGDAADTITIDADVAATIDDGPGDDRVYGSPRGDLLVGAPGDDILEGRGGDDRFGDAGGAGADSLDGGAGNDLADYGTRNAPLTVSADGVADDGYAGERDDVRANVEQVRGGSGDDRLSGGDGANSLYGGTGDDVLDGRGGADRMEGNGGRDVVDYGARGAALTVSVDGNANDAGEGDNVLTDVEEVRGGSGDDVFSGNSNANTFIGGPGSDTLNGGPGNDTLVGEAGDDDLVGEAGDDVLAGGDGHDEHFGGSGSDAVDYRERTDPLVIDLSSGRGPGGERLDAIEGAFGGSGNDRIVGGAGDGRLEGGDGDDVLSGGSGRDRMAGGNGRDRVDYSAHGSGVNVSINDGADDGAGSEGDDVRRDVEEIVGSRFDDRISGSERGDLLVGNGGADVLSGNSGDDRLDGGDGGDDLRGGAGNDHLDGGAANDRVSGDDGNDRVIGGDGNDTVDGGRQNDHLSAGSGNDRLNGADGDDIVEGDGGNDTASGGGNNDAVRGGDGDDRVVGDAGDDTVEGGEGADKLEGHDGNDRLDGGGGNDELIGNNGDDQLAGAGGNDRLSGSNGDDLLGGGVDNDHISGDAGADRLIGDDGDDQLYGGSQDDVLVGGWGADRLQGDSGEDTVDYSARVAGVRITNDDKADDGQPGERDDVRGSTDHVIGGAGGDLVRLRTDSPHRIYGEGGNDTLDGGPRADLLVGGSGNDQLIGRGGNDTFDGGEGNDRLSGADALAETLRCGRGKDSAMRDRIDKAIGCERLKIGKPAVDDGRGGDAGAGDRPETRDIVPIGGSPGTQTGVRKVTRRGRFVSIPGSPGERIDSRLLRDVAYLKAKYKIAVTAGFAMTGHAVNGEHPVGLALDIVPGAGGSWSDIDRLAKWAEPRQNRPRAPFRWVGYNGDPGHGRGNHLHLSWSHAPTGRGRPAPWVMTFAFKGDRAVAPPSVRLLTSLSARSNFRIGGTPTVKSGIGAVKRCGGPRQLVPAWKAAAKAFGLRASILGAITEVESAHGCNMGPSSAGAIGWTQFLPSTWKMWGMDADGDGKASPYNSVDAIFSTARYLRSSGAPENYRKALYAYNHAGWYVDKVLAASKRYR